MSSPVRIFQVDAFTTERFAGNPAGVVLDADALSDVQMHALARELSAADSAFVLRPDGEDHDLRVRFFTPRGEANFIGHATLAAHAVLQALNRPALPRQKQNSGIIEVIRGTDGLTLRLPVPPLGTVLAAADVASILAALGLELASLDERCPVQMAGTGSTRLLIALRSVALLDGVRADATRLGELSQRLGIGGFFLFTVGRGAGDTESRMFCPALGIPEDPVSGNAHGMLGHYLWVHGLLAASNGQVRFLGRQGRHVGRPGQVQVCLALRGGRPLAVEIAGRAVIVYESSVGF